MKRYEKFNHNSVAKKQKTQEDNDVWGDDLEFDEVDKCLTQLETQNNNLTLTSYNNFKTKTNACSTQAFLVPNLPSTSKNFQIQTQNNLSQITTASGTTVISKNVTPQEFQRKILEDIKKLEEQNKKLVDQYKTKDGEISFLRTQLKQAQKTADSEKMQKMQHIEKTQQQWSQKYNTVIKERDNVRNELDLKQLEVINLREKLRDLKFRTVNPNDSFLPNASKDFSLSQSFRNKRISNPIVATQKLDVSSQTEDNSINVSATSSELSYPLQRLIPHNFFDTQKYEHCQMIKLHSFNDGGTLLRPNSTQYENAIDFKPPEINKIILSTDYFFTELVFLMKCTKTDLCLETVIPHIHKVIFVTSNLLSNALEKLSKAEKNLSNEDLRHMNEQYLYGNQDKYDENKNYCIFSAKPWSEEELLIELRRSLAVLATLALNNLYLVEYLKNIPSRNHNFTSSNNISQIIDLTSQNVGKCDILDNILKVVKIIGKIRRSHQFSGFFSSVLLLISNLLTDVEVSQNSYVLLHSIFQEVVFSRPNTPVLKYMSALLRKISFHNEFLTLLCKNSKETSFRQSKTSFNFSKETCTFQVLIVLLETYEQNIPFIYDMFSFLSDALKTNCCWFHSQETIRCLCLCRFCISSIDLLYKLMLDFKENLQVLTCTELRKYRSLFQMGFDTLNILTHHYAGAVLNSSKTHSQYLMLIKDMSDLDKHIDFDANQTLRNETLIASICNNNLNEEDRFKTNDMDIIDRFRRVKL